MPDLGELPPYPVVDAQPRYPEIEERILAFWRDDRTFEASVEARPPTREYVFYDGPPFANGLPHYGHLLTGFVKDAVPRYQTMRGKRVERRFGWDCHGLPAELEAERELGVAGREAVTALGVDRFNDHCRRLVLRTTDAWERYVTRQGRWVDFANAYRTMDLPFMESVLWAFKRLYETGLVYEGFRVLPYCWECETPLSNFETRQDDAYRERVDDAVTVRFDLEPGTDPPPASVDPAVEPALRGPLRLLVWTTTPWTLPSNLALAVGPGIDYALLERDGERLVLARDRLEAYSAELAGARLVGTFPGAALVGRRYRPLFPYFSNVEGAFVVLAADFVATDEGTGIVHLAPGFGEEDQRVCEAAGLPVVCPVDERGRFTAEVADLAGVQVFDANPRVIAALAAAGSLVRHEQYAHSYPHCWRSDTPLIYRALSSWFVRVSALKDRMVELNKQIHWVPEHVRDGAFGKWLEGARDWSISRNRFWGTPIPVWKSDDPAHPRVDVYGSLDELARDFGVRLEDLHRPMVDELVRPNPDDPSGRSTMRRVTDVLDCWFESGSMPFAQLHYPFENVERFESHFPADFIVEYVGQTRGWFYTLHVLATALFDRPPFLSCIAHGIVLGDDGRKLSKRLRNFPDPEEVFARYGADAMRFALLSSPVLRGLDLVVEERAFAEPVRQVLNPIWNTWHFLSLYARADKVRGRWRADQKGLLDRYLLARTRALVEAVTEAMEADDLPRATAQVAAYLDALTNWYVRRSRDRFWRPRAADRPGAAQGDEEGTGVDPDKRDAYDTLHTALEVLCRVAAPFLPFLCEEIYRGLTGRRSVHLERWPDPEELPADADLVGTMELAREVCSAGHSIRKANRLRARLPLARLTVAGPGATRLAPFRQLIAEEVNVKEVELLADLSTHARWTLGVFPKVLGPRLGPRTQEVIAAAREGRWAMREGGDLEVAGVLLHPGEYDLRLRAVDEDASRTLPADAGVVVLDLETTPELEAEGLARDVVRLVQQARRDAGLEVTDRVHLVLALPEDVATAVASWRDYVARETLATSLDLVPRPPDAPPTSTALPDGRPVEVSLALAR